MHQFLLLALIVSSIVCKVPFQEVCQKLSVLENYAKSYYSEKSPGISVNELILRYVRTGRYTGSEWTIAAGDEPTDFIEYVTKRETEEQTGVSALRKYSDKDVDLPDGNPTDFVHMFAVMNGIDYQGSFTADIATLQGWSGDTAQLFQDIFNSTGSLDELIALARTKLGVSGRFGPQDLISDLDAVGFIKHRYNNPGRSFSELFLDYLNAITHQQRIINFVDNSFPGVLKTRDGLRNTIFNSFSENTFVNIWECKQGIRQPGSILGIKNCYIPGGIQSDKVNNHKAAAYAFADYIFENL